MKWLKEFGKGFINLGNILIGIVAFKAFFEKRFSISSLSAAGVGILFYILEILGFIEYSNEIRRL